MPRSLLVALILILGIGAGLVLQPDDGTAVSRPPGVGLKVDGANHAKPLPRIPSVADLLPALCVAIAAVLLLLAAASGHVTRRTRGRSTAFETLLAPSVARRGPPRRA